MNAELPGLLQFVDELADVAADSIMPHFRAAPSVESKGTAGFDPVTVADRDCRDRHAPADQPDLAGPRHRRRGAWQRARGRRLRLGARPDRRHPRLHHRPAELGHADRPPPQGHAGLRHDGPGLHPRALLGRRRASLVSRAGREDRADPHARLRRALRCGAVHHLAADSFSPPTGPPTTGSNEASACPATVSTATPIAWSPPATPIW